MITILGPTASGKTALAARVAYELDGEVISADSRQVYRGMSIGTGKDLNDYIVNEKEIPYHLIDIADPGYEYNVYEFQRNFSIAYNDIVSRRKLPILCGGSGLYLDSVLKKYRLPKISIGHGTVEDLRRKSDKELREVLLSLRRPHNTTDLSDRDRMIRAIMISLSTDENVPDLPDLHNTCVFGIRWKRNILLTRIESRLKYRLDNGMIEEVKGLLDSGISPDKLKFYGLEYRYITQYIRKELEYDEMFRLLNIAIRQFAKRQMTWFRKMERDGIPIHWLEGELPDSEKVAVIKDLFKEGDDQSGHPIL